jgi:hypothetical protein
MIGRIMILASMYTKDLARRRAVMGMLVAVPLAFYLSSIGLEGSFVLVAGGIGLGMAVMGAGLFLSFGSRQLAPRLALAGYRPGEIVLGQLITLVVLSVPLVLLFSVIIVVGSNPPEPVSFVVAVGSTALVAAALGLVLGSLVPGELEGTLALIGLLGVQMSVPVTAGFAAALPFYGPTLLIERAYGTAIAIEPALPHGVFVLALSVALAYLFSSRRIGAARAVRQAPRANRFLARP